MSRGLTRRRRRGLCAQVAYAIGIAKPLSTYVNTYGTGSRPDSEILEIVHKNFDLRPFAIIKVGPPQSSPWRHVARRRSGRDEERLSEYTVMHLQWHTIM